jgi:hypothetical protein
VGPGDPVSFFPFDTFTFPAAASATVATIVKVTDVSLQPLLASAHAAAAKQAKNPGPCSACRAGLNNYAKAQLYNVTFTAALPAAVGPSQTGSWTAMNCDGISNTGGRYQLAARCSQLSSPGHCSLLPYHAGAVVKDCDFGGSNSNLGRWKSAHGRILRTTFRSTVNQNLEISPLQNWLEGMLGSHDISIEGNVFHGTRISPVKVFGEADVTQTNNTCVPTTGAAVPC